MPYYCGPVHDKERYIETTQLQGYTNVRGEVNPMFACMQEEEAYNFRYSSDITTSFPPLEDNARDGSTYGIASNALYSAQSNPSMLEK